MQKNERKINSNLPCKFGHCWRMLKFWDGVLVHLGAFGAQTWYDVICNFTPIIFLAHWASFMSRWPLLGGGVCISVVGKQPYNTMRWQKWGLSHNLTLLGDIKWQITYALSNILTLSDIWEIVKSSVSPEQRELNQLLECLIFIGIRLYCTQQRNRFINIVQLKQVWIVITLFW